MTGRWRVMIVDDSALIRLSLCELLTEEGFEVVADVGDGRRALALASELQPHAVVLDWILHGDLGGAETLRSLRHVAPETPVVVLTAYPDPARRPATRLGASAVLPKEMGVAGDLVARLAKAVSRAQELSRQRCAAYRISVTGHERAAQLHSHAAALFEAHGKPDKAEQERRIAREHRAGAAADRRRLEHEQDRWGY